jgi:hypothetical protein
LEKACPETCLDFEDLTEKPVEKQVKRQVLFILSSKSRQVAGQVFSNLLFFRQAARTGFQSRVD